jgi:hypothetical protein
MSQQQLARKMTGFARSGFARTTEVHGSHAQSDKMANVIIEALSTVKVAALGVHERLLFLAEDGDRLHEREGR